MAPQICEAMDLWVGKTGWSVIVQVLHRYPALASNSRHKFRKYVLTDMQGTIISAAMYGQTIPLFENLLQPYKRYKISNARLTKVESMYKISDYDCSWTITNKTPVELLDDTISDMLPCLLPTVPISALQRYAGKDESINIAALVVQRLPPIQQTAESVIRNYVLITEEKMPIILTHWLNSNGNSTCLIDDALELPEFFVGMNLKVTTYNGLSLTTKKFSHMMAHPPVPAAQQMLEWYASSSDNQAIWKHRDMNHNVQRFFTLGNTTHALTVETAKQTLPNVYTAWVKGNLEYVPTEKGPWSVICGYCTKLVDADAWYIMTCIYCNQKEATVVGTNLTFKLYDKASSMLVTAQYPVTNDVIIITPPAIKSLSEQGKLWSTLNEMLENKEYAYFVKFFSSFMNQQQIPHFSVLKFLEINSRASSATDLTSSPASSSSLDVETTADVPVDSISI